MARAWTDTVVSEKKGRVFNFKYWWVDLMLSAYKKYLLVAFAFSGNKNQCQHLRVKHGGEDIASLKGKGVK